MMAFVRRGQRGVTAAVLIGSIIFCGWLMRSLPGRAESNRQAGPCPERGEPCRVLPLGDSITCGINYQGGYRIGLFGRAHAAGQLITFTGSLRNGPLLSGSALFPRNHEGRSGWTIAQVSKTVPHPALDTAPHIVLLHVGTNDIYAHSSAALMADALEALLDRLEHATPTALIAVAEIVPLTDPMLRDAAERYNAELRRRVRARQARGERLLLVDQFSGFPLDDLSDGVHPTRAGYDRMAEVWYRAIAPYLR